MSVRSGRLVYHEKPDCSKSVWSQSITWKIILILIHRVSLCVAFSIDLIDLHIKRNVKCFEIFSRAPISVSVLFHHSFKNLKPWMLMSALRPSIVIFCGSCQSLEACKRCQYMVNYPISCHIEWSISNVDSVTLLESNQNYWLNKSHFHYCEKLNTGIVSEKVKMIFQ